MAWSYEIQKKWRRFLFGEHRILRRIAIPLMSGKSGLPIKYCSHLWKEVPPRTFNLLDFIGLKSIPHDNRTLTKKFLHLAYRSALGEYFHLLFWTKNLLYIFLTFCHSWTNKHFQQEKLRPL